MFSLEKTATATLLILGVLICSLMAGRFILERQADVRDHAVQVQSEMVREGLNTLRDLLRLNSELNLAAGADGISDQNRKSLSDAYDFLYVRADALRQMVAKTKGAVKTSDVDAAIVKISALIALGDEALISQAKAATALHTSSTQLMDAASQSIMSFVNAQYLEQADASQRQLEMLNSLTIAALGILAVFALVSCAAVLIVKSQYRLQLKWRQAQRYAKYLARFDPLTKLPNRSGFRQDATAFLNQEHPPLLFICDLDGFKIINDVHGHEVGDAVLRRVAGSIGNVARRFDGVAARLGGDEFAFLLPGPQSSMRTAAICDELIAELNTPKEVARRLLPVSLSIGVAYGAVLPGDNIRDLSALQRAADTALYRAKLGSKNTYAFFDAELAAQAERRSFVETAFAQALENQELSLAYQPQIDLQTDEICGFEVLARWTHRGEFISPGEFIPIAEETGRVLALDLWCFRTALESLARWLAAGGPPVKISSNFAPLHFKTDAIVAQIRDTLQSTGVPPNLVTLEVTESMMIDDLAYTLSILARIRETGVSLALDDFGTGYASLANLQSLDLDYIKIDKSLIDDLDTSAQRRVVLKSLVDMAKGLNKKLIIEGIETESQAQIVRDLTCEIGQGYLFGRPMPEAEAMALLGIDATPQTPVSKTG